MIYVLSGGGKLFAIIAVTYPEGSICTCSNGTKTLKARDTSGKALFNVPLGEWTVSCTDGSRTKSAQVSITAEGQSESVTLNYRYMIFDNGTVLPLSTWKESGTITIGTDSITYNISGAIGSVYTTSPIDLTEYNVLKAKYTCTIQGNRSDWNGRLGYKESAPNNNLKLDSYVSLSVGTDVISSLDISSVTGNKYITVWGECTATIKEIWLE